jgi:hypothetical protein
MSNHNGRNPKFEPRWNLIPDTNWLKKHYNHYCERIPHTYPEYNFATGLAFVQMATGRKAYIAIGGRKHFSNLNQLCLGPTTTAKKTDAIDPVKEWFRTIFSAKELPTDFSGAGLLEALEVCPDGYIVIDEAGTLFNRINNSKEAGTIRDVLCKVYDGDERLWKQLSNRGKKDGTITIDKPFPTILLGTTPETFSNYAVGLDMSSGWMVRFLMYNPNYAKESSDLDFDYIREDHDKVLIKGYDKIVKTHKEAFAYKFKPDKDAVEFINRWKKANETRFADHNLYAAIFGRLMIMTFKIVMNVMLADIEDLQSRSRGSFVEIPKDYIEFACDLVDSYFIPHAISVYEMIERDASKNIQDKILSKLAEYGGDVELWKLSKNLHITANIRDEHLHALQESREVMLYMNNSVVHVRFWKEGDDLLLKRQDERKKQEREERIKKQISGG